MRVYICIDCSIEPVQRGSLDTRFFKNCSAVVGYVAQFYRGSPRVASKDTIGYSGHKKAMPVTDGTCVW